MLLQVRKKFADAVVGEVHSSAIKGGDLGGAGDLEGRHADSFDDRRGGTVALVEFGEHLCQTEWAQRVTDHAVSGFGGVAMAAGARCEAIEHFEADIVEGP